MSLIKNVLMFPFRVLYATLVCLLWALLIGLLFPISLFFKLVKRAILGKPLDPMMYEKLKKLNESLDQIDNG